MCLSMKEWIQKMWDTHIYYSAIIKQEILPFTTTWIKLEGITLNGMSDRERQILHELTYGWNLKHKFTVIITTPTTTIELIDNGDLFSGRLISQGVHSQHGDYT